MSFEDNLSCNHEEADTRLLLHAKKIRSSYSRIVIHTPDTDVLLIALAVSSQINGELMIKTRTQNKARIISLSSIRETLKVKYELNDMDKVASAVLGLHGFTSCDTVCAFSGKGKIKPPQLMLRHRHYWKRS